MSDKKFVKDYLDESKFRLETAKLALDKKRYNSVVRESQLAVELSLKAFLLRWNFIVPKTHEISNDILDSKDLFSKEAQKEILNIVKISKKLRREYEISLYGDKDSGKSLSDLYTKIQAEEYLSDAKKVYFLCEKELNDFLDN